jgi:hypothetical protein
MATITTIIQEALLSAGDTSLTERALLWANQWLRSTYKAWPWPFLQKSAQDLTLTTGTTSKTVGGGSGGVADVIQRIYDPIYMYTSDKRVRGTARFSELTGGPIEWDERARPSTQTGLPQRFKARPSSTSQGVYTLIPDPIPDRDLLFAFDYIFQPSDLSLGQTPIYPNDRTINQAILHKAWEYMADPRASEALDILRAMTVQDRINFGQSPGVNVEWGLDGGTFKG